MSLVESDQKQSEILNKSVFIMRLNNTSRHHKITPCWIKLFYEKTVKTFRHSKWKSEKILLRNFKLLYYVESHKAYKGMVTLIMKTDDFLIWLKLIIWSSSRINAKHNCKSPKRWRYLLFHLIHWWHDWCSNGRTKKSVFK